MPEKPVPPAAAAAAAAFNRHESEFGNDGKIVDLRKESRDELQRHPSTFIHGIAKYQIKNYKSINIY